MNELEVQKYLRSLTDIAPWKVAALDSLEEKYGIKAKQHSKYPSLFSLKYNMIESPMEEPLVQECRGIILDANDNWNVVARPFDKFFNVGEDRAHPIDWDSAKVVDKMDGSLMILYHYDDRWNIASSGTPDASGNVNDVVQFDSFADLWWHTWELGEYTLPSDRLKDFTFMFELMTPFNRAVVPHEKFWLTLIGIRNRITGEEFNPYYATQCDEFVAQFPLPRVFPIGSVEEMMEASKHLDPLEQEGYVVVDRFFRRVKVKTPQYVALSHMRDSFNSKAAVEIVRTGEGSEVVAYFPHYKYTLDIIQARYDKLVSILTENYERLKGIESQKEFALEAVQLPMSDCLFAVRRGKAGSVTEYLRDCQVDRLYQVLHDPQFGVSG